MEKIALIYMGGTFGCVGNPLSPMPEAEFLAQLQQLLTQHAHIDYFAADKIQDSSACTAEDWLSLILQIQKLHTHYQHFVVIHGTDTLSYAAATLAKFLQDSCHVILTGSQYPLLDPQGSQLREHSDAISNLNFALENVTRVAAGVYLGFHQQLFYGSSCIKVHSTDLNAFQGQLYTTAPAQQPKFEPMFKLQAQHIEQAKQLNIINWMMQPITQDQLAQNLENLAQQAPQFLILQGYGIGNITVTARILSALAALRHQGCLNILTTQVTFGELDQRYAVSQWVLDAEIFISNSHSHADLYAKILKIYLQYRTPDQCAAHWYDHHR